MAAARPYKCKNMEEIIKMSDKVIYAAILGAGTVSSSSVSSSNVDITIIIGKDYK